MLRATRNRVGDNSDRVAQGSAIGQKKGTQCDMTEEEWTTELMSAVTLLPPPVNPAASQHRPSAIVVGISSK